MKIKHVNTFEEDLAFFELALKPNYALRFRQYNHQIYSVAKNMPIPTCILV